MAVQDKLSSVSHVMSMQCFISHDSSSQRAEVLTMAVKEELFSMAWLESSCIRFISGRWFTLPNAQMAVEMCEAL